MAMNIRFSRAFSLCSALLAFTTAGCGAADSDHAATSRSTLELFSWWTAPSETDALQALIDIYKSDYEDAKVAQFTNTTAATWQQILEQNIDSSPWNAVQISASDIPNFTAAHPDKLEQVDSFYQEPSLAAAIIPDIRNAVTVDGHAYGVVTGVHRNNAFLYSKHLFDSNGLKPPTTIAEFLDVSARLKDLGITPVATSLETWALRILFDDLLAGTIGAEQFRALVQGETPPTNP